MSDLQSRYEVLLSMVQNLQLFQNLTSVLKTDASPKTPPPVGRVGEVEESKINYSLTKPAVILKAADSFLQLTGRTL